jgi:hypothetical protein
VECNYLDMRYAPQNFGVEGLVLEQGLEIGL